jgi:hypothetical protein
MLRLSFTRDKVKELRPEGEKNSAKGTFAAPVLKK